MSFIKKPRILHPRTVPNGIGLTIHDYEGAMSTLCAGCGHDSVSAAIIQSFFELGLFRAFASMVIATWEIFYGRMMVLILSTWTIPAQAPLYRTYGCSCRVTKRIEIKP